MNALKEWLSNILGVAALRARVDALESNVTTLNVTISAEQSSRIAGTVVNNVIQQMRAKGPR
jgi:hypothetical protein